MLLRLRDLLLCLWLLPMTWMSAFAAPAVVIVSSERSPAYVEAAEALVSELQRSGLSRYDMLQLTAAEWSAAGPLTPKLVVALGTVAADVLAKSELRTSVLCTLLPRSSFERILLSHGRRSSAQFSALYLDQPLSRQLDLIRLALPDVHRVGVLLGPESQVKVPALVALAPFRGFQMVAANVDRADMLFPALKRTLEDSDVLLAIPDPLVYNSSSIQNILLASFRAKVPLVTFSPAYVRAGSLLALHTTPTQIGVHAGTLSWGVVQDKALPSSPVYPRDFTVSVNEHVARSLGLSLDAAALREQLLRKEGAP